MSSLASSPPKSGGEPPHNWSRTQYSESHMRSSEGGPMGQTGRDGYSAAEMAQMRRSEMEKARMYAYESRGGAGGQYSAMHMHHMAGPYHGTAAAGAYMRHMTADRDYAGEMDEYADYPGGMKMNSVSSAVREVATRMNEVRLGHAHGGHMMASHPMDSHEHMDGDYGHRGNAEMMASMRERMSMRGADMMAMHEGKMHGGYGNAMLMSLGARGIKAAAHHSELLAFQDSLINVGSHGGVPYIAAAPSCLPFAAMHGGGYGGSAVAGAGMAAPGGLDMHSMHPSGLGGQAAKHNKYCHFCQHVKVRASGMLACCNKDCTRRFCEHCLSKSIGDDVNPQTSSAWVNGQWHCPVCRKLCCCAIGDCDKNHRHCKAYRYRVRRAEQQAVKRAGNPAPAEPDGSSPWGSPRQSRVNGKADSNGAAAWGQVKAEAAIEIDDKQVRGSGAHERHAAIAHAACAPSQTRPNAAAQAQPREEARASARLVPGAAASGGAARAKTESEPDTVPLAPACSPASSGGAASAMPSSMPSPASMGSSPSVQRRLQSRRDGGPSTGIPAPVVDVNDVQTMADSWLRLLEEEEDDLEVDFFNVTEEYAGARGQRRQGGARAAGGLHASASLDLESHAYRDDDAQQSPTLRQGASRHTLPHIGSSDSLNRIMSIEEGGGMLGSSSSHSLNELMQRNTPESMMLRDTLSRNVSNVSLTEMVRNYSSGSLEAVMEQGEGWPDQADAATYASHSEAHLYAAQAPARVSLKMGGGDLEFLQADDGGADEEGAGEQAAAVQLLSSRHLPHHNYLYAHQASMQASTGKRMHRTHSHNKLVHEAVSAMGRGLPRPASYEKLSRQCAPEQPKQ